MLYVPMLHELYIVQFWWKAIAGANGLKNDVFKPSQAHSECSEDEISLNNTEEEGLECPICWESLNIVENVPYVLLCGHTSRAPVGCCQASLSTSSVPFFISYPLCNFLSFSLVYKGNLKFPRKNFFLLWMVESMNGDRVKPHSSFCVDRQSVLSSNRTLAMGTQASRVNHSRAPCTLLPEQMEFNQQPSQQLPQCRKAPLICLSVLGFLCSLDSQIPTGDRVSSYSFVCNSCQCSYLGPVHSYHYFVCSPIFSSVILCVSWFGLAG